MEEVEEEEAAEEAEEAEEAMEAVGKGEGEKEERGVRQRH